MPSPGALGFRFLTDGMGRQERSMKRMDKGCSLRHTPNTLMWSFWKDALGVRLGIDVERGMNGLGRKP